MYAQDLFSIRWFKFGYYLCHGLSNLIRLRIKQATLIKSCKKYAIIKNNFESLSDLTGRLPARKQASKKVIQQRVNSYLAALRNLEYLIRMPMIDRDQAIEWSRLLGTHDLPYAIPYYLIQTENGWWRIGEEELLIAALALEQECNRS